MSFLSVPISIRTLTGASRKIGSIDVNVVVDESTNDTLTITKQPIQQGASITDHAYKEPTTFSMRVYFRDNLTKSLSKIYQDLLELQESRVPFEVTTPKRIYKEMLISVLIQTTDKATENTLSLTIGFQQVIIVKVSTTQVPRQRQKLPKSTAKTEAAGKKSVGVKISEGVTSAINGVRGVP